MTKYERMVGRDGALIVVDLQTRLIPAIDGRDRLVAAILRLVWGAQILEIPTFATEQVPEKLGPTVDELAALIPDRPSKTTFHACVPAIVESLTARYVRHVTLAGIEAHICVAQTALELLRLGFRVQVAADAVGSRFPVDRDFAFRRLEATGVVVTTAEAVLFEWLETAEHPRFREVSALVKGRTEA